MRNSLIGVFLIFLLSGCMATVSGPIPPPAPQVEVEGAAPFVGAVWVPGYWGWHRWHHRYNWHHGYWRR